MERGAHATLAALGRCLALGALAVLTAVPAESAPALAAAGSRLYVRQGTLQESLLAARARYTAWCAEQPRARAGLTWSAWSATGVLATPGRDAALPPETAAGQDPAARGADGQVLWTPRPEWHDATMLNPAPQAPYSRSVAVYLLRTVTARDAVSLTVGLGGGDHLAAWLNGRPLVSTPTALVYERYGTSMRTDGTHRDQVLADVDLPAGESRLLVKLYQAEVAGHRPLEFWFSAQPDPVPALWAQVRSDYAPAANPLLDLADADWFGPKGWFAAGDRSDLERALVPRLAEAAGEGGAPVRRALAELLQANPPATDPRWLSLCVTAAEFAAAGDGLARLRAAVADLGRSFPGVYSGAAFAARLEALGHGLFERLAAECAKPRAGGPTPAAAELAAMRREMLVAENPLLKGAELLFVRRYTYDSMHYYDDYYNGVRQFGGNLCVLSLADGRVRPLAPALEGGIVDRYDLSFDARRVAFGYRPPRAEGYRVHEVGVDGTGLRQVVAAPADDAARVTRYSLCPPDALRRDPTLYGHWTDDLHPCYLPDGGLAFVSTRQEHSVLCGGHSLTATNLFRVEADGSGLQPLSRGALSEFTPTLLADGRILYNRWEYIDKGIAAIQPLWAMRPDGSGSEEIYGDDIADPGVFVQARQIPGSPSRYVCTACSHEPLGVGAILLLDLDRGDKRTRLPMVSLTPDVETRGLRGLYHRRHGQWQADDIEGPLYCDPYPLADPATGAGAGTYFLVSCNPDRRYNHPSAYGLYLLDRFGNRVPIHTDPEMSCFQPMPLRSRPTPPVLPAAGGANDDEATLLVADVYRGLTGVRRGEVKYLRVMEQIPRPWSAWQGRNDDAVSGQMVAVSYFTRIWIAVLLGVVPVQEDGSAQFTVPANRNLYLQALDGNFMEVQRMRTFIHCQPGERRSCIGCHEVRRQAPGAESRRLLASRSPPVPLGPQPGEVAPRVLDYATDVQPVLDRRCVGCHGGPEPKAGLTLSGELTEHFCRSYEELLGKGSVNVIREWTGPALPNPPSYFTVGGAMANAEAVPPYTYGSHQSKMITNLRRGHNGVQLSRDEFVKLATWVDNNAPYYGSYFGRRNLRYRKHPDFRPVPTLASARGTLPEPPRPEPVPSELVGWWKLDEANGERAVDAIGAGHDGRIAGATWAAGPPATALAVDGRGYVEVGDLGEFDTLSVALWVKPGRLINRWSPLLFVHDFEPGAFHLSLLTDGAVNVAINADGNHVHRQSGATVADGAWHHVAVACDTRSGGTLRFYVDGKLDAERPLDTGLPVALHHFRLGAYNVWQDAPDNNYHGALRDVRVYRGLLSPQEVTALAAGR